MKTTELIQFLVSQGFTDDEAYNLIVNDLFEFVPEAEVATEAGQRLVSYFMYKIQQVCLPAIRQLKEAK